MTAEELNQIQRGQRFQELKQIDAWPLIQELLHTIGQEVVHQWCDTDPTKTDKVLALHAKANAVRWVQCQLVNRVQGEIDAANELLNQQE